MSIFSKPTINDEYVQKLKAKHNIRGLIDILNSYLEKQNTDGVYRMVSVTKSAIDALGEFQDARAVKPLIALLGIIGPHKNGRSVEVEAPVRKAAKEALVKIGAPAVESVIGVFEGAEPSIRSIAAEILGKIGDVRAVEPLIMALNEKNEVGARIDAAKTLGKIGDRRAVEPLIIALSDKNATVETYALESLGEIRDQRALQPLLARLEKNPEGSEGTADALFSLGWRPGEDESGVLYWIAKKDWDKCKSLGSFAVDPLLSVLKREHSGEYRAKVASALGEIGDSRAFEPLLAMLTDKDEEAREGAVGALGYLRDTRAVEPLIKVLEDGNEKEKVLFAVEYALCSLGDARALYPLVARLNRGDNIIYGLGLVGVYSKLGSLGEAWIESGNPKAIELFSLLLKHISTLPIKDFSYTPQGQQPTEWYKQKLILGELESRERSRLSNMRDLIEAIEKCGNESQTNLAELVADSLVAIYVQNPEGIYSGSKDDYYVGKIGQALHKIGGMNLMLAVHREFAAKNARHARNLEMKWNGIGEWLG